MIFCISSEILNREYDLLFPLFTIHPIFVCHTPFPYWLRFSTLPTSRRIKLKTKLCLKLYRFFSVCTQIMQVGFFFSISRIVLCFIHLFFVQSGDSYWTLLWLIDWLVCCLLAGPDLWKRMPFKYSITKVSSSFLV